MNALISRDVAIGKDYHLLKNRFPCFFYLAIVFVQIMLHADLLRAWQMHSQALLRSSTTPREVQADMKALQEDL